MKTAFYARGAMIGLVFATTIGVATAQNVGPVESPGADGQVSQQLALTQQQKSAILQAVGRDKSRTASVQFPTTVGAEVPPSINLYTLPDEAVNNNSEAKLYQFTVVQGDVVIVDPTRMRVVEVIRKLSH